MTGCQLRKEPKTHTFTNRTSVSFVLNIFQNGLEAQDGAMHEANLRGSKLVFAYINPASMLSSPNELDVAGSLCLRAGKKRRHTSLSRQPSPCGSLDL